MISIEELERVIAEDDRQRAALKAHGFSDSEIDRIVIYGISSVSANFSSMSYMGSELIDCSEGSVSNDPIREAYINAERRKIAAANAALKSYIAANLQVGPTPAQWTHYLEVVRIKAQTLAYSANVPALNFYKNDVPEPEAKNIVQYEIDCLGWYKGVRNEVAGLNHAQLQVYLSQRNWDKVSLQIILDRINDVLGRSRQNFLEQELAEKQAYKVPIETIQVAIQKAIHAVGETLEQQKANDLLYETIEKANRQIWPGDAEQYGIKLLEAPPEVVGNPKAIADYLAQIEPLTSALNSRWVNSLYKPDKKPGGLLGKIGREFNKGLANMGPIGKIVKPLIQLGAVATGNPWVPISTSVGMGFLDSGAEGATKGLLSGIMGAAGQQIAMAQEAGIPLGGEKAPAGTLVANPEALQVAQELRQLTTEQLLLPASAVPVSLTPQVANLTEEAIKTACYMAPMAYSYASELTASTGEAVHDAQIKKKRKQFYKSLSGMGFGTFASSAFISSIPVLEGQSTFAIALGGGAIFGAVSSAVSTKNLLKGAFEGAFTAGAANVVERGLSQAEWLKEVPKLREALGIAASSTIHTAIHHGKLKEVFISVGSDVLSYVIVPKGVGTINEETLRVFVTAAIATLASRAELGESIMASWLGSHVQKLAKQYGEEISRNTEVRQPKKIADKPETLKRPKEDNWRLDSLKMVIQKASAVLAKKNLYVSDKEIQQTFAKEPVLQGSREEVLQNLIDLGKIEGALDNKNAFIKGLQRVFDTVLDKLVSKAYGAEMPNLNRRALQKQNIFERRDKLEHQIRQSRQQWPEYPLREWSDAPATAPLESTMVCGAFAQTMINTGEWFIGLGKFTTDAFLSTETVKVFSPETQSKALARHTERLRETTYALVHCPETAYKIAAGLRERFHQTVRDYEQGHYFEAGRNLGDISSAVVPIGFGGVGVTKLTYHFSRVTAKTSAQGLKYAVREAKGFVNSHKFTSPITFHFKALEQNAVRLNAGIPTDTIKIKLQKPWSNKTKGIPEKQLTPAGLYYPEPLLPFELARIRELQAMRNQYLKWQRELNLSNIPKVHQKLLKVTNADRAIRDKMKPNDAAAIFKEERGIKIYDKKSGKFLKHRTKAEEAQSALSKVIVELKLRLQELHDSGQNSSFEAQLIQEKLSRLSKFKDLHAGLIREPKCQTDPNKLKP